MRFVYGPIPPSRVINPQDGAWTPLRELNPTRFAAIGGLVALPFSLIAAFLLMDRTGGLRGLFWDDPLPAGAFLLAAVLMTPVHELITSKLASALAAGRDRLVKVNADASVNTYENAQTGGDASSRGRHK